MSGYAFMTSLCVGCRLLIAYNPHKVPSILVDGVRQPVCATCIVEANKVRLGLGYDLFPDPHPDAYEPIRAEEL